MTIPPFILRLPGFDPDLRALEVPQTESCHVSVDRIALSAPVGYFNEDVVPLWFETKGINLIGHGDTVFINIHPEWYSSCDRLSFRVFTAVFCLAQNRVLNQNFTKRMEDLLSGGYYNAKTAGPHWPTQFLSQVFELAEWETTLDFYDYPVLKSWNPEDFHRYINSVYSNDNRKYFRKGDDGRLEAKGKRDSFMHFYPRHFRVKLDRECYRMEFLHAKENAKKDLSWDLLNGDEVAAFYGLLPSIALNMNRITKPENLIFDPHWIQFAPDWFKHLLLAAQWLDPATNTAPPPRRPRGATVNWSLEASKLLDWDNLTGD